jgi:hypothetical protein
LCAYISPCLCTGFDVGMQTYENIPKSCINKYLQILISHHYSSNVNYQLIIVTVKRQIQVTTRLFDINDHSRFFNTNTQENFRYLVISHHEILLC